MCACVCVCCCASSCLCREPGSWEGQGDSRFGMVSVVTLRKLTPRTEALCRSSLTDSGPLGEAWWYYAPGGHSMLSSAPPDGRNWILKAGCNGAFLQKPFSSCCLCTSNAGIHQHVLRCWSQLLSRHDLGLLASAQRVSAINSLECSRWLWSGVDVRHDIFIVMIYKTAKFQTLHTHPCIYGNTPNEFFIWNICLSCLILYIYFLLCYGFISIIAYFLKWLFYKTDL